MVTCICVRGFTLAQFDTVSVWKSCSKPSDKFPHGGMGECIFIPCTYLQSFLKNLEISCFFIFSSSFFRNFKNLRISWIWRWHCLYLLVQSFKSLIHSGQEILEVLSSITMQKIVNSIKNQLNFLRGPKPARLSHCFRTTRSRGSTVNLVSA